MKNHFNSFLSNTTRLRILFVYLFLFLFCSCKTSNRHSLTTYHPLGDELSGQLENTPFSNYHHSKTSTTSTISGNNKTNPNCYNKPKAIRQTANVIAKESNPIITKKIKYAETISTELEHKEHAPSKDFPFNFDKYSNAFWQIGGVLFLIGLFLFWMSLLALLQINTENGVLLSVLVLLLGVAFLILSLPFILIGAIIGNASKVKSGSEGNEIY